MKNFGLGEVIATPTVWMLIDTNADFSLFTTLCLSRYIAGDWGDISDEDKSLNDKAVKEGDRIIASYLIPQEVEGICEDRIWISTEGDRSLTMLLFPGDY